MKLMLGISHIRSGHESFGWEYHRGLRLTHSHPSKKRVKGVGHNIQGFYLNRLREPQSGDPGVLLLRGLVFFASGAWQCRGFDTEFRVLTNYKFPPPERTIYNLPSIVDLIII